MEVIARCGAGVITYQGAYPDEKGEGRAYRRQLAIYFEWLKDLGIRVLCESRAVGLDENGVRVLGSNGTEQVIPADTVFYAGPRIAEQPLFLASEYLCDEVYVIGDAVIPRDMHRAIHDAYRLGVRV